MKRTISKSNSKPFFLSIIFLVLLIGFAEIPLIGSIFIGEAEAVVGRPVTPGSVAGVARRTTRRTVRRIAYGTRVTILPITVPCVTVIVNGLTYHQCGQDWYQPHYQSNTVIYVVVVNPN